jgi:hypothetical protein
MPIKISCPHCTRALNVTEPAFGKTVPCPACNQPIKVPYPVQPSGQTNQVAAPILQSEAAQNGDPMPDSARPMPAGMPPMPSSDGAFDFLNRDTAGLASSKTLSNAVRGMNLGDMFAGNEKEYVFCLLPGEERLDELTIHHQHLFLVKAGVTRLTLTTNRLLYTATRVFSPVYWLLLVLFPPLIFYYAARLSRNRNVALPLGSIDSVEKRYRPNWLWFVLAIVVGHIVASLCSSAIGAVFSRTHPHTMFGESSALEVVVYWLVLGVLGLAVLVLLLATRIVGIEVRSRGSNRFSIHFGSADVGVSEQTFDSFLQKVHVQMEHARILQLQPNSAAT